MANIPSNKDQSGIKKDVNKTSEEVNKTADRLKASGTKAKKDAQEILDLLKESKGKKVTKKK
jgi:hypothetical protein